MQTAIYCGNNRHELSRGKRLGTPYECLKQGVGVGLHSSLKGFNPSYDPIIQDATYCGTSVNPPPGKTIGTPTQCLMKGVGIGKRLQYERGGKLSMKKEWWIYLLILSISILTAIILRRWWVILIGLTIIVSFILIRKV